MGFFDDATNYVTGAAERVTKYLQGDGMPGTSLSEFIQDKVRGNNPVSEALGKLTSFLPDLPERKAEPSTHKLGSDMGADKANLEYQINSKTTKILDEYGKTGKMTPAQVREEKKDLYSEKNQLDLMGKSPEELTKIAKSLDAELKTLAGENQARKGNATGADEVVVAKERLEQKMPKDALDKAIEGGRDANQSIKNQEMAMAQQKEAGVPPVSQERLGGRGIRSGGMSV